MPFPHPRRRRFGRRFMARVMNLVAIVSLVAVSAVATASPATAAPPTRNWNTIGNQTTGSPANAVSWYGNPLVFIRSPQNRLQVSYNGGAFFDLPPNFTSNAQPAATLDFSGRSVWVFWTGQDGHVWVSHSSDITNWTGAEQVPNGAGFDINQAPAVALDTTRGDVYVFSVFEHRIFQQRLVFNIGFTGTWAEVPGNGNTIAGIAAAYMPYVQASGRNEPLLHSDTIWLSVRGNDSYVYFNAHALYDGSWSLWYRDPQNQQTETTPSLTAATRNGVATLNIAVRAPGNLPRVSSFSVTNSGGQSYPWLTIYNNDGTPTDTTLLAPAIAAINGALYLYIIWQQGGWNSHPTGKRI